jgi:RHS repeat-associated protein
MLREKDYTNEVSEYYIYTASDERIGVKYGTSSGSPTIWSIRDFNGNVLRQYESHDQSPQMAWLWVEDYVYRDGQLLAAERVPEEGGRRHFHLDHLGSPRLVTGQDSKEMSEHDFGPFGLESNPQWQETAGGFDREDPKRFTGHERDYAPPGEPPASTAYLDYMHARFYTPALGRFLSIDPASGQPKDPRSWNGYSYVLNNPVKYFDVNGLCEQKPNEPPCTDMTIVVHGEAWRFPGKLFSFAPEESSRNSLHRDRTTNDVGDELERVAHMQHCVEGTIVPLVVAGGEVVAGGAAMLAGGVLAETGITAAGPSYGISLIFVPAGFTVFTGGVYLAASGASTYSNTINNSFGTHLPSASKTFPRYFPAYPPPGTNPCKAD